MKWKSILFFAVGILLILALALAVLFLPVHESEPVTQMAGETKEAKQEGTPMPEPTIKTATEPPSVQTISTVTFPASDGLTVTADLYWTGRADAPMILLFHQANYSRGEYLEIAPKLNALGYNCLAVDQRSGGTANGVKNETHQAAKAQKLATEYTDAFADLEASLSYLIDTYAPEQLIVWGSSYSSSLSLILASQHPEEIDAVLAFSPGEYFKLEGKLISDYAKNITQPAFITSAKSEEKAWRKIAEQITSEGSVFFVPQESGRHGSSALFDDTPNHAEYWTAVEGFLASLRD